jgi:hypothetical protein
VADAVGENSDAGSTPSKRNSAAGRGSLAWQDQQIQLDLSQQQVRLSENVRAAALAWLRKQKFKQVISLWLLHIVGR